MADKPSKLKIADREFTSRLLVGTGKFASNELMRDALAASGTEIVTVALRRADLSGKSDPFANILDFIDPKRFLLLPNTSGARNAAEAVRLARLAVTAGLPNWVKLEIHPDPRYLLPDGVETLAAAEILVKEGFVVLPYINADPVLAKRLQDVGTATVMPLGSPIGSNRGIETRAQIEIIIEQATVPVVVDAGLGAPSQAAEAFEMGADAVLVNTAIAIASDPSRMAHAFRKAIEAGREAYEIGLAAKRTTASATSPLTAFFSTAGERSDPARESPFAQIGAPPPLELGSARMPSETVELRGHIIDSLILPKVLDTILTSGGNFKIGEIRIGEKRADQSYAQVEVSAPTGEALDELILRLRQHGAEALEKKEAQIAAAPSDGISPQTSM